MNPNFKFSRKSQKKKVLEKTLNSNIRCFLLTKIPSSTAVKEGTSI